MRAIEIKLFTTQHKVFRYGQKRGISKLRVGRSSGRRPVRYHSNAGRRGSYLAPIFHRPIQIAGSIFANWPIMSHFRQVHRAVGPLAVCFWGGSGISAGWVVLCMAWTGGSWFRTRCNSPRSSSSHCTSSPASGPIVAAKGKGVSPTMREPATDFLAPPLF
jgi:hypothetical protein